MKSVDFKFISRGELRRNIPLNENLLTHITAIHYADYPTTVKIITDDFKLEFTMVLVKGVNTISINEVLDQKTMISVEIQNGMGYDGAYPELYFYFIKPDAELNAAFNAWNKAELKGKED